jgi:hypothetical protein
MYQAPAGSCAAGVGTVLQQARRALGKRDTTQAGSQVAVVWFPQTGSAHRSLSSIPNGPCAAECTALRAVPRLAMPTRLQVCWLPVQGITLAALGAVAAATFLDEGRASPGSSQERLPGSTAGVAAAK